MQLRRLAMFGCLIVVISYCASPGLKVDEYVLGQLLERQDKQTAPPDVVTVVARYDEARLRQVQTDERTDAEEKRRGRIDYPSGKHGVAPDALQDQRLDETLKQETPVARWALQSHLLAVVPIDLDDDGAQDFLVYPARFCSAIFGAHAVPFWIVKCEKDGGHRVVLSGADDAVRFLKTRTNGLRDIDVIYGLEEPQEYKYDGQLFGER